MEKEFVLPEVLPLPELAESLMSFTGEDTRIPRLEVPSISVSYKDEDDVKAEGEKRGEFVEYDPVTKQRKALGANIVIQILHHRQSLSSFADDGSVVRTMFTPEVSLKAKELSLFQSESAAGGKKSTRFLMKADIKKLRESFPELGYRKILYVIHDGQLKSLVVKGATFSKFIELTKTTLNGASSSSVLLKLGTEKGKKGTVTFYAITFTPIGSANPETVKAVGTQLAVWFAKHDELQDANQKVRSEERESMVQPVEQQQAPQRPVSQEPEIDLGDLNDLTEEHKPVTEDDLAKMGF